MTEPFKVEGVDYSPEGIADLRAALVEMRGATFSHWPEAIDHTVVLTHAIAILSYTIELQRQVLEEPEITEEARAAMQASAPKSVAKIAEPSLTTEEAVERQRLLRKAREMGVQASAGTHGGGPQLTTEEAVAALQDAVDHGENPYSDHTTYADNTGRWENIDGEWVKDE